MDTFESDLKLVNSDMVLQVHIFAMVIIVCVPIVEKDRKNLDLNI